MYYIQCPMLNLMSFDQWSSNDCYHVPFTVFDVLSIEAANDISSTNIQERLFPDNEHCPNCQIIHLRIRWIRSEESHTIFSNLFLNTARKNIISIFFASKKFVIVHVGVFIPKNTDHDAWLYFTRLKVIYFQWRF